jgi:arginyl-tRNA synthetase
VADFGKEIVKENIGKVFEESDGAVVFRGENIDKKLHTRVFINKEGLPTYEAKELGLSKIKYERFPYDRSVIVTGNEINEYFKVLLAAMKEVFPDLAEKTKHISHGMLRLPEGKMSSRTGNVIAAESLIAEVKKRVLEKMKESEVEESQKDETAEIIAIAAIKYSVLRQAIGGDIVFDFDKSISFEGDSGPYLQYSVVRAQSILKKAEGVVLVSTDIPEKWTTTLLEKMLERFSAITKRAGSEYAPHYIATYLIELSSAFNGFYAEHKIIDAQDPLSSYRLAITHAFVRVMEKGLHMLGIEVPEKM